MNKVKLLLAGSVVAVALLTTGCSSEECADITVKENCDGKTDSKGNTCAWDDDKRPECFRAADESSNN
ncbi:MAG: hypothetical protein AAF320_06690 [Myxococcota bacterium]